MSTRIEPYRLSLDLFTAERQLRQAVTAAVDAELERKAALESARRSVEFDRRHKVEQRMLDSANGKRPMPDQRTLRLWALCVGTPHDHWTDEMKESLE